MNTSPIDVTKLCTCYNSVGADNSCLMKTAILKLPAAENSDNIENLEIVTKFDTSNYGSDIKTTEFHPTDEHKAVSVTDNQMVYWDISGEIAQNILSIQLEGKNSPKYTTGKWNPHQNCNQVTQRATKKIAYCKLILAWKNFRKILLYTHIKQPLVFQLIS